MVCQCATGTSKRALELFTAEINNVDSESYCSDYLLKHGVAGAHIAESGQSNSSEMNGRFKDIALLPLRITTLHDALHAFDLHRLAVCALLALGDSATSLSTLVPTLFPACGLSGKGFVYSLRFWEDLQGIASYAETRRAYQVVFPHSHIPLDGASLQQSAANTVLSPRPRSQAKKRGFSEAALETTVPGGFVSAAQLAADEGASEPARYAEIPGEKSVLALYLLLSLRAGDKTNDGNSGDHSSADVVCCLCRVTVRATAGKVETSAPAVLQKYVLGEVQLSDTQSAADQLKQYVAGAHNWAEGQLSVTNTSSHCQLPANAEILVMFGGCAVAEFANTEANNGSGKLADALNVIVSGLPRSADNSALAGWKPVLNSLPGHMQGKGEFASGHTTSVLSLSLALRTMSAGDALDMVCLRSSMQLHIQNCALGTARNDDSELTATELFATRLLQCYLSAWSIPAASANIKLEVLKRVKFLHALVALIDAVTSTKLATHGTASAPKLRPVQFHIAPSPTTANASGCAATMMFTTQPAPSASVQPVPSPGPTPKSPDRTTDDKGKPQRNPVRVLVVDVTYTCSTMRGQGRSINHAESCEATLRDVLPGRFCVRKSGQELLADGAAGLHEELNKFVM
jgi:hypothetical protein